MSVSITNKSNYITYFMELAPFGRFQSYAPHDPAFPYNPTAQVPDKLGAESPHPPGPRQSSARNSIVHPSCPANRPAAKTSNSPPGKSPSSNTPASSSSCF